MSIYEGLEVGAGPVRITSVGSPEVEAACATAELSEHQKTWFERAQRDERCVYFGIRSEGELKGQILLHDIDAARGEAMVGYHIFQASQRGLGIGTKALTELCTYAFATLRIRRLVAITSLDNMPSRRIATKCGFRERGAAREGSHLVVYERTSLPISS